MTADFDALVGLAAKALDDAGLWPRPDENVQDFKERAARDMLEAVGLPALLERVEAAEALVRAIEDSRLDPARAIVKADQLAGAAIIAAHKAEVDHAKCVPVSAWVDEVDELTGERDALAAKVAAVESLADRFEADPFMRPRDGSRVAAALRAALTEAER